MTRRRNAQAGRSLRAAGPFPLDALMQEEAVGESAPRHTLTTRGARTAPMLLVPRFRLGPLEPLNGLQAMHDQVPDRVSLRDPQAWCRGPQALDVAADPAAEFRVAPEGQGLGPLGHGASVPACRATRQGRQP